LEFLREGDTVIDIGANIGCFALAASKRVGISGRVIAMEPEQRSFECLSRNIAINVASSILPIRKAVAGQSGAINIHSPSRSTLFSSMFDMVDHHKIEGEVQTISSVTLEHLVDDQGVKAVKLLKMDCEGAEHEIIASLTPAVASKIDNMIIEFHQISGRNIEDAVNKLKSLGYKMHFNHNYIFARESLANQSP
jgi:FkbM family methyltransferase